MRGQGFQREVLSERRWSEALVGPAKTDCPRVRRHTAEVPHYRRHGGSPEGQSPPADARRVGNAYQLAKIAIC